METLEKSRMCRLCGKSSGIAVDIFDKNENHVRKINAILPILVHEMDVLPKQMCHRCSYKLDEFYSFYVDCAKTDAELKNLLSWMKKDNTDEKIITPMVKMNRFKIKTEFPDDNNFGNANGECESVHENSLLFPASILQNSYDSSTGPIVSCSKCQCVCYKSIKVNKQSPKEIELPPQEESENFGNSSSINSAISNKLSELTNESKCIDKDITFSKNLFEHGPYRKISEKEIQTINLFNIKCGNSVSNYNVDNLISENRALRPRKGSVDYMGSKKKVLTNNLKAKFKSKLDLFDPLLVNPVEVKMNHNNIINPSPIIKLEKLDDKIRTLRTRKNLEEFNRKIKEFQREKSWRKQQNKSEKILHKENKSLLKEEKYRRKSLQRENQVRKSLQKEENVIRQSLHKEENIRNSLQYEENILGKSEKKEESSNKKNLPKFEDQNQKSLQKEENKSKKSLVIEKSKNLEQFLDFNTKNSENDNFIKMELKIKQEIISKAVENNEPLEEQAEQEECVIVDPLSNKKVSTPMDRIPLCAVVKLEKDYTCNVDYPRIKIKRHLAVVNPSKLDNSTLENPVEKNIFQLGMEKKQYDKDDNCSPKNLRSKEKKVKIIDKINKSGKVSKKKGKDFVNGKRLILEKGTSVLPETDLKCYCDECDTSFRNRELYKLHPCYQK